MDYGDSTPPSPFPILVSPRDQADGASASLWMSLADYRSGWILINAGAAVADTCAITLDQATDKAGSGSKTLGFTKYYQNGQRIYYTKVNATAFVLDEAVTYNSTATATIKKITTDFLTTVILTGDHTQVDGETMTGDGGGTAVAVGTGQDDDIWVEMLAGSNTFTMLALPFVQYLIPIDSSMLDTANDFDHFQLDMADAGSSESLMNANFIPRQPRITKYPAVSLAGAYHTAV